MQRMSSSSQTNSALIFIFVNIFPNEIPKNSFKTQWQALMGNQTHGIDPELIDSYAKEIKKVFDQNIEIAIVIGGGNIFRGVSGASKGMDRVQADYMGMLATVINDLHCKVH